jgi:hypothetical protein
VKGSGTGAPTGSVDFYANYFGTVYKLGPVALNGSGQASLPINTTDLYSGYYYTLYAVYSGNSTTYTSTSPDLTFFLRPVSYVSLSSNLTTITPGQTLTFTADVGGEGYSAPTGTVTFYGDGVALATEALVNGDASLTVPTSALPAGNYSITVTYSGDEYNGAGSSTSPLVITVQ